MLSNRLFHLVFVFLAALIGGAPAPAHAASTEIVSIGSEGQPANDNSYWPSISADGRFVVFTSRAANLDNQLPHGGIFIRDRKTGTTTALSGDSAAPEISANGRFVAFAGSSNGMSGILVRDLERGTTERVDVNSRGEGADKGGWISAISSDGRFVAFISEATNLVAGDTNTWPDVFVRDRVSGTTDRVNLSTSGSQSRGGTLQGIAISADGRYVAFSASDDDLTPNDTIASWDIFVRDRLLGVTERVSVDSNEAELDGDSMWPSLSSDGRFVAFIESGGATYVRDRKLGATERVDVSSSGTAANGSSVTWGGGAPISADGRFVAFCSMATNLVPGVPTGWKTYSFVIA